MSRQRPSGRALRELAEWAVPLRFRWSHTSSGHIRWDHPRVEGPVFTASTPRDPAMTADKAKLRRALRRAVGEDVHA